MTASSTDGCNCTVSPARVLPRARNGWTLSFNVGGAEGYLTTGEFADGSLSEVFVKLGKQGSTLAGALDAFSVMLSTGLQAGVPLETLVKPLVGMRFEPAGLTDDKDVRNATSVVDFIARKLALIYLSAEERADIGVLTAAEKFAA